MNKSRRSFIREHVDRAKDRLDLKDCDKTDYIRAREHLEEAIDELPEEV
jgi:hypothetical protein